jgi:hypothetical protein
MSLAKEISNIILFNNLESEAGAKLRYIFKEREERRRVQLTPGSGHENMK